ncbi:MAG: GNAT family N-acetyltransferase [Rhodobacteraceae bacterium]|nr:GNAT family N-acetyltransferase [Paracoccaceae bacterium]
MTPSDLATLHALAFTQSRPWSAQEFAALLNHNSVFLVALPDGFALWRAIAGEAELLTLAVEPKVQRRGIGTQLMQHGLQEAATRADTAFLEVAEDNQAARALYAKHQFSEAGRRLAYYARTSGDAADALILRRNLDAAE